MENLSSKSLRIGNFVNEEILGNVEVVEVSHNGLIWVQTNNVDKNGKFNKRDFHLSKKNYQPIPLNEKWILKFGFEYTGEGFYRKSAFSIEYDRDITANDTIDFWFGNKYIIEVKYVHELQNLFFALTGRELEMKTVCECEYPIIRQDLTEYCSICQKEVK